jgi:hypothetical protein
MTVAKRRVNAAIGMMAGAFRDQHMPGPQGFTRRARRKQHVGTVPLDREVGYLRFERIPTGRGIVRRGAAKTFVLTSCVRTSADRSGG